MPEFYQEYVEPIIDEIEDQIDDLEQGLMMGARLAHDLPKQLIKEVNDTLKLEEVVAKFTIKPAKIPPDAPRPKLGKMIKTKITNRKPLGNEARELRKSERQRIQEEALKRREELKSLVGDRLSVIDVNHKVPLTRNERKRIIAAIAACESAGDFGAINADTEFHFSKDNAKKLGTSYSGVVHVGLSWGIIQFTQDSGQLGKLLSLMQQKNPAKFEEVFGDNWEELLRVTNSTGEVIVEYKENAGELFSENKMGSIKIGKSALDDWRMKLDKKVKQKLKYQHVEVRGPRVQSIAVVKGGDRKDIWTDEWKARFQRAGKISEFCHVQLDYAVDSYLNPLFYRMYRIGKSGKSFNAKTLNIVSGVGLAFVAACHIRGAGSPPFRSLLWALERANVGTTLDGHHEEEDVLRYIVDHAGNGNKNAPAKEEGVRARLLLSQISTFLDVKEYDVETYDDEHDR